MEPTALDWILFGIAGFLVVVGLFRGLSGELGSVAGVAAALVAGYFLYGAADRCAVAAGFDGGGMRGTAAVVIDFIFALLVFGFVRLVVARFISWAVPQPTNALLGALAGLFKSVVLVGVLTGVGFVRPGEYSQGIFTAHSHIIRTVAGWADAYAAGACGMAP